MSNKVAVIGAGPMGLAVAYELSRLGRQPVIFDADDRVGGMTATFDFDGLNIERFYHFHCISDSAFLQMLDELGIADKMRWVETKMGYWYQGRVHAWGNPLALLRFPGLSLSAKLRYGVHAFASAHRKNWRALDELPATAWIRQWVGEEAFEVLWRKLFEYKFYEYANRVSAAWIWSRIRRIGRSRYDIFREKLGYLEGGSNTLLTALTSRIERQGGTFRLACPVEQVVIEDGCVKGLQTKAGLLPFDRVVSTAPLPYVPRLIPQLPPPVLEQYEAVQNIAVVCVIAKLKKRVTDAFWLNTNDPEMDIPGIVEYTNLRPLAEHIVYVPFYMPGHHPKYQDADAVFLGKVRRYLKTINPALRDDDFLAMRASRYRYAQPVCPPGFLDRLPPPQSSIKGLWIADTSYYYPEDRGISESIEFGRRMGQWAAA